MPRKETPVYQTESEIFPVRLRELMERSPKTTQQMLADKLKITRQAVAHYLNGQSSPDWKTIAKIAQYFNVSTDYLLGITNIQSAETDLRAVCEYTGLSEKTVVRLSDSAEGFASELPGRERLDILEIFVCHEKFGRLLLNIENGIRSAKEVCKLTSSYVSEFDSLSFADCNDVLSRIHVAEKLIPMTDVGKDRLRNISDSILHFKISRFETNDLFMQILSDVIDYKKTTDAIELYDEIINSIFTEDVIGEEAADGINTETDN